MCPEDVSLEDLSTAIVDPRPTVLSVLENEGASNDDRRLSATRSQSLNRTQSRAFASNSSKSTEKTEVELTTKKRSLELENESEVRQLRSRTISTPTKSVLSKRTEFMAAVNTIIEANDTNKLLVDYLLYPDYRHSKWTWNKQVSGTPFSKRCSVCDQYVTLRALFCSKCGFVKCITCEYFQFTPPKYSRKCKEHGGIDSLLLWSIAYLVDAALYTVDYGKDVLLVIQEYYQSRRPVSSKTEISIDTIYEKYLKSVSSKRGRTISNWDCLRVTPERYYEFESHQFDEMRFFERWKRGLVVVVRGIENVENEMDKELVLAVLPEDDRKKAEEMFADPDFIGKDVLMVLYPLLFKYPIR